MFLILDQNFEPSYVNIISPTKSTKISKFMKTKGLNIPIYLNNLQDLLNPEKLDKSHVLVIKEYDCKFINSVKCRVIISEYITEYQLDSKLAKIKLQVETNPSVLEFYSENISELKILLYSGLPDNHNLHMVLDKLDISLVVEIKGIFENCHKVDELVISKWQIELIKTEVLKKLGVKKVTILMGYQYSALVDSIFYEFV